MTALGIMTHHPELNSVACLMGSGYFRSLSQTLFPSPGFDGDSLSEWDVSHQLASLARRPLLLWHGDADDVVPPEETFRLEQALGKRSCRQADLRLAERRPPSHYARGAGHDGRLFQQHL
jgi:fermentation-respiration switch protein FrsA (DUF1100 family)